MHFILDYGFYFWLPYNIGLKTTQEKVQNKYLRFLAFMCDTHFAILYLLGLNPESPVKRRFRLDLYFIYNLLNDYIDRPNFLSRLTF